MLAKSSRARKFPKPFIYSNSNWDSNPMKPVLLSPFDRRNRQRYEGLAEAPWLVNWWFQVTCKVDIPEKSSKNTDAQTHSRTTASDSLVGWNLGDLIKTSQMIQMCSQLWESLIYLLHPMKLQPILGGRETNQRIWGEKKGSRL